MYCSSCGHPNSEGTKFCESCGQPLSAGTPPSNVPAKAKPALSKGYRIAAPGASVAVLCFFLPWILVSCGGQQVASFSGWQLAAGTTVGAGFGSQQVPGKPVLFLVLLTGLAILALAYFAWQRGRVTKVDGGALIGLGGIPLLVLLMEFAGTQNNAAQQGIQIEFQIGFWGVVLGYIAAIVGGVLDLKDQPQGSAPPH